MDVGDNHSQRRGGYSTPNEAHIHSPVARTSAESTMAYSVSDLLEVQPREGEAPFSLHVLESGSGFAPLAYEIEVEVFGEAFGLSPAEFDHHYGNYNPVSDHVLLVDREKEEAIGTTRVVRWNDYGFPTFVETQAIEEWDRSIVDAYLHHGWEEAPTRILDIATAALKAPYRADGVGSMALFYGSYMHSRSLDSFRWVTLLEEVLLELMIDLGVPWERLCDLPPAPHQGSLATVPVTLSLRAATAQAAAFGKQLESLVAMPPLDLAKLTKQDRSVLSAQ